MKKVSNKRSTLRANSKKTVSKAKNGKIKKAIQKKSLGKKSSLNIRTKKTATTVTAAAGNEFTKVMNAAQTNLRNLDASLLKISPQLQTTVDNIMSKIEKSPVGLQDLQALATRVLKHATEISDMLKKKVTKKN